MVGNNNAKNKSTFELKKVVDDFLEKLSKETEKQQPEYLLTYDITDKNKANKVREKLTSFEARYLADSVYWLGRDADKASDLYHNVLEILGSEEDNKEDTLLLFKCQIEKVYGFKNDNRIKK